MARPFQPYEPELQKLSSNAESPMSPVPRGETPVSFKPNVNRAKTKRWVEAKKYSYDGNDWGDDEYGEYDDDEPPPVPQHNLNQSTGDLPSMFKRDTSRPPLPSMDRSRSMDHVATLAGESSRSRSSEATAVEPATRTVPIIRPADIYKRMRADSAAQQDPSQSSPAPAPANATVPGLTSAELHLPSTNETPAGTNNYKPFRPPGAGDSVQDEQPRQDTLQSEPVGSGTPTVQLPDVKRLSSFDPDFAGDSYFPSSDAQGPEPEQHQLQHNPSMGFRSVVHQAFDVPDTPSTTVDSVARSNSDSTSVISPIISHRTQSDLKTPTIVEEPGESTPPSKNASDGLVFKPGHRRDISLPSPNNSPSRTPKVTNIQGSHPSAAGEMSVETATESSLDSQLDSQPAGQTPQIAPVQVADIGPDHPAPLSIGSHLVTSAPTVTHDGVPIIIPSMSTDDSPQDTESDRLRKEIMRSLSRENTPSKEQEDEEEESVERPEAQRQDSLIPSEYERYWSAAESTTSPLALDQSTPEYVASPVALQGSSPPVLPPAASESITSPSTEASKSKLARRFSWESSSSSEEPAQAPSVQSPPAPMPGQFPVSSENQVQPATETDRTEASPAKAIPVETFSSDEVLNKSPEESDSSVGHEKPKLTILPPVPDNRSIISDSQLPEVYDAEAIPNTYTDDAPAIAGHQFPQWTPTAPASVEPTLLGFREILAMKSSEERVQAFNDTRTKFGTIDTGLSHWLQVTVQSHPEHADVVDKSTKLATRGSTVAVTRKKFAKLSSLGNFGSSQLDVSSPSGSGHVRRPSAPLGAMMNKQQVEQRGKELLHSAGVLGGRAGEAAKGLFARGRSKLKGGHSDKGFQAFRGYRKPLPLTELQNASAIDLTDNGSTNYKRHTVHFGSLPLPRTHSGFIQRKWQVKRKATPTEAASRAHLAELGDTTLDVRINGDGLGPKQQEPFVQSSGAITVVGEMGTFEADDKVHPSNRSAQLTNTHLLPDSTGASRIQFTINGTPMTTPADGPDHGCTASGEQREAGISIEGRPANQSSDSIKATRDEALLSWTVGNPPARFVEHRREASQLSVSSLGTADDGGPNLALNTHAASSSLSLPSSLGGGMDTAATGDARSMTPSRLPHGRHLPHQHTQVSSISSCPPSRTATPVPAAPPSAERNDRASASHPTPQARLAAMKMKYGEKIRDIRRISISAKEPEQKPTPPYKNAFGRLTGLLRPRRGNKPKISSVADTDCRPATSASIRSPKVVVPINHIDPALSKPGHARFYSVDNNSSLSDRHHLENVAPDQLRSTSLTPDPFHRAHIIPPNASDPVMPTRTASQTSSRSPSRGRDPERGYTRNLHMRSRSPKPYAPGPEGETASITDITDPAHNLGIFRTRPRTSRSGDQELPWKLSIPGGDDEPEEIHKNDRKAHHRESSELWSARITGEVLSCIGNSSILQPPPPPQPSEPEPPKNNTQKQPPARVGNAPLLNPHPSPGRTLHRRAGSNVVASDAMIPPPPPPPPQFKLPAQPLTLLAGNPDESKNKAAEQQRPSTSQAPAQDTKRNNDEPDNPPPPQTAHPHRPEPPRAIVNTPIELPVPARDGADDSTGDSHEDDESEIVMSSTAYPGQEWKPVGFMGVGMGYD